MKQRWLILGLGFFCYLVALLLDITQYQNFLFLVGSFFVPLFGILAADYFVLRWRRYRVDEFYRASGAYWYRGGLNGLGLIGWILGIVVYHVTNPTTLGSFFPDWQRVVPAVLTSLGGSLPSFTIAFLLYAALGALVLNPRREHLPNEAARRA